MEGMGSVRVEANEEGRWGGVRVNVNEDLKFLCKCKKKNGGGVWIRGGYTCKN